MTASLAANRLAYHWMVSAVARASWISLSVRIPGHGDHCSEVMAIAIPK